MDGSWGADEVRTTSDRWTAPTYAMPSYLQLVGRERWSQLDPADEGYLDRVDTDRSSDRKMGGPTN